MVPRLPSVQDKQMSQHKLSPASTHVKHEMFLEQLLLKVKFC